MNKVNLVTQYGDDGLFYYIVSDEIMDWINSCQTPGRTEKMIWWLDQSTPVPVQLALYNKDPSIGDQTLIVNRLDSYHYDRAKHAHLVALHSFFRTEYLINWLNETNSVINKEYQVKL